MSKFFLFLKTDVFRKNLIIALIFIIVIFLLVYFGLRMYTKHGDSQEVPVLKGLHVNEAIKILENAGLNYEIDSIYQLDAKPGLVVDQDPEQKSHVKSERTIYITIITQVAPEIAFPDIIDKTLIEASSIIKNHSLKIGDTIYVPDIARDVVLDVKFAGQSIEKGRMISKGSRIDLILGNGRGDNEVAIPLLVGFTLSEAKFALTGIGLNIGKVTYAGAILDSLSAKIITQTPDTTSSLVSIGSLIDVTLSN